MDGYDPSTYGERIADAYDRYVGGKFDDDAEARVLAELAAGGRVLELGVGTGRVAIPLAGLGLEVHGVEASPAMIEALREAPGGQLVHVTLGDFGRLDELDGLPPGPVFALAFAVFSTLFMLPTQDAQVACFAQVAARLRPGGAFVVEGFSPRPQPAEDNEGNRVSLTQLGLDGVVLEATRHDAARQRMDIQRVQLTADGVRLFPSSIRYAHPSELDLMARLAGLERTDRWGAWDGRPFTSASTWCISVYRKPG